MLILIAGATGNLGQHLITSSLSRNHSVRVLARNPDKIAESVRSRLESSVSSKTYYDIEALDRACAGVDAVICAYTGLPELQVDAQLLLLRAAERAGVRKYIAHGWNYDWRNLQLGQHESYDPYLCFHRQAELSSAIKPVYIFVGVLAEVLFSTLFTTKYNGIWDADEKRIVTYGNGDEKWHITTYADAAEYTIEILQSPEVEEGGFFKTVSFVHSTKEIAELYGQVRDIDVPVVLKGDVEDLRKVAMAAREKGEVRNYLEYIGWFYQLYTLDGTWTIKGLDNDRFPGAKATDFAAFLKENPEL